MRSTAIGGRRSAGTVSLAGRGVLADPVERRAAISPRSLAATPRLIAQGERPSPSPEMLRGAWMLDFRMFGCGDGRWRGGLLHVEAGRFFGGHSDFAFEGCWRLSGDMMIAELDIYRHHEASRARTLFDTDEDRYRASSVARLVSHDLIEGRIRRAGFRDARFVMRRLPSRPR